MVVRSRQIDSFAICGLHRQIQRSIQMTKNAAQNAAPAIGCLELCKPISKHTNMDMSRDVSHIAALQDIGGSL